MARIKKLGSGITPLFYPLLPFLTGVLRVMDDRPASPPYPPRPPLMLEQREEVPPPRLTDNGCEEGIDWGPADSPTPDPNPTSVTPPSPAAPAFPQLDSPLRLSLPHPGTRGTGGKKKKSRPPPFPGSNFPQTAPPSPPSAVRVPFSSLAPPPSPTPFLWPPARIGSTRPPFFLPVPPPPPPPPLLLQTAISIVSLGAKPSRDRPGRCQPHSPAENGWRGTPDPPNLPSSSSSSPVPDRAPGPLPAEVPGGGRGGAAGHGGCRVSHLW